MSSSEFFQSSDFKRVSGTAADSGIKMVFRLVGIGVKALIDFITSMFKMVGGKY